MFSLLVRRLGEIVEEGHGDRAAECSKSKRRAALLIGDSCEPHFDQWCSDAEREKHYSATIGTSLYHCATNCAPFGPLLTTHLKATHGIFVLQGRFPEKSSSSFGFCPNEGGGSPAQIFCLLFTNCILGQFGDGERGGDPCTNFLTHWRSKKW